ncbi:MAG TPA: hypothetical protein VG897_10280 [Terriglobales bacterium]|nr:hypothetical protein [Terriglobales bacterium]
MDVALLAREIQQFIAASSSGAVIEDGEILFDLSESKYSLSTDNGRCVVHFWSSERNCVRRVLDVAAKNGTLRLQVQRLGKPKPTTLEICSDRDRRPPSAKHSQRATYEHLLERVLRRTFPGFTAEHPKSSVDLERSFGPIYARGTLHKGNTVFAVIGVNAEELQASVDGVLTIGLLWLDYLREHEAGRKLVAGLKIFVPPERSPIARERMAHLNHHAASFELYEFDQKAEVAELMDASDRGNIDTRLVHCPNQQAALERFKPSILEIRRLVPECDVVVLSPSELSFRVHGLEFARARIAGSIYSSQEIVFGVGPSETVLNSESSALFGEIVHRLCESRQSGPARPADILWRMAPERWLESLIVRDVIALDYRLDPRWVYSQVPAFAASDRAMIDVLTATTDGRLAVLELKADEDLHLPMQGLDYWARVSWHHTRGEFQKFGYFNGATLSEKPPILMLVAPALRIHPTTDKLLRYFSTEIDWELVAVNEDWRDGVKTVFRKRRNSRIEY